MLSDRLAMDAGSTPAGTGTRMESANGPRAASLRKPPELVPIGSPYIAMRSTRSQFPVYPRRQVSHSPHEIWNGTLTTPPAPTLSPPAPTSVASATHSWPKGNGSATGASPATRRRSRSQVATESGRTSASPSPWSWGSSASRHSRCPLAVQGSSLKGAAPPSPSRPPPSAAGEVRVALLDERSGPLEVVLAATEGVLELGLQIQLAVQVTVDRPVQGLLRARI